MSTVLNVLNSCTGNQGFHGVFHHYLSTMGLKGLLWEISKSYQRPAMGSEFHLFLNEIIGHMTETSPSGFLIPKIEKAVIHDKEIVVYVNCSVFDLRGVNQDLIVGGYPNVLVESGLFATVSGLKVTFLSDQKLVNDKFQTYYQLALLIVYMVLFDHFRRVELSNEHHILGLPSQRGYLQTGYEGGMSNHNHNDFRFGGYNSHGYKRQTPAWDHELENSKVEEFNTPQPNMEVQQLGSKEPWSALRPNPQQDGSFANNFAPAGAGKREPELDRTIVESLFYRAVVRHDQCRGESFGTTLAKVFGDYRSHYSASWGVKEVIELIGIQAETGNWQDRTGINFPLHLQTHKDGNGKVSFDLYKKVDTNLTNFLTKQEYESLFNSVPNTHSFAGDLLTFFTNGGSPAQMTVLEYDFYKTKEGAKPTRSTIATYGVQLLILLQALSSDSVMFGNEDAELISKSREYISIFDTAVMSMERGSGDSFHSQVMDFVQSQNPENFRIDISQYSSFFTPTTGSSPSDFSSLLELGAIDVTLGYGCMLNIVAKADSPLNVSTDCKTGVRLLLNSPTDDSVSRIDAAFYQLLTTHQRGPFPVLDTTMRRGYRTVTLESSSREVDNFKLLMVLLSLDKLGLINK